MTRKTKRNIAYVTIAKNAVTKGEKGKRKKVAVIMQEARAICGNFIGVNLYGVYRKTMNSVLMTTKNSVITDTIAAPL